MATTATRDISTRIPLALDQDTFIRANTTASTTITTGFGTASSGSSWSSAGSATMTYQVVSNQGVVTASGGTAFQLLGTHTLADAEALVRFQVTALSNTAGIVFRFTDLNNHYRVRYVSSALGIVVDNAGTTTTLATTSITTTINTLYWIRARIIGNTLYGKMWKDGTGEPTAFQIQTTDSTFTSANKIGLVTKPNVSSDTVKYDSFVFYDASATLRDISVRIRIGQGRDIPTRVKVQGQPLRDTATRVRAQGQPLRDLPTRANMQGQPLRDTATRVRAQGQPSRDIGTRVLMGLARDLATRLRAQGQPVRDLGARARIGQGRDLPTRLRMQGQALRDLAIRIQAQGQPLQDITTRTRIGQGRDLAARLRAQGQPLRDIVTRTIFQNQVATDTFIRSDSSSWGTASDGKLWATLAGSAANFTIVSNEGQFTGSANLSMQTLGTGTLADGEAQVRFTSTSSADNIGIVLRCDGTSNNFYRFRAKGGSVFLTKTVGGTNTDLANASFTLSAGTYYWLRARIFGSVLSLNIWQDGTAEPGGWVLTTTDSSLASAGTYGLFTVPTTTGHVVTFDHFTVTRLTSRDIPTRIPLALDQDTFSRANTALSTSIATGFGAASSGSSWASSGSASMTYQISGNEGLVTGSGGTAYQLLGSHTLADGEALVRFSVSAINDTAGLVLRFTDQNNHYRVRYFASALSIVVDNAGATTTLATTPVTLTGNTYYWIRARIIGNTLYGKMWKDGTTEPTAFQIQATDATFTGANKIGLVTKPNVSSDTVKYDSFVFYDAASMLRDITTRIRLQIQPLRDIITRLRLALDQDTFIRANTTASTTITTGFGTASSGSSWSSAGSATMTYQVVSNQGVVTASGGTAFQLLGTHTLADAEALVRFQVTALSNTAGIVLRFTDLNNHYRVRYFNSALGIVVDNAGTTTTLATASVTTTINTLYWIRARIIGSVLYGKMWQDGTSEPAAFQVQASDATFASANKVGLVTKPNTSADTVKYDSFVFYDVTAKLRNIITRIPVQGQPLRDLATRIRIVQVYIPFIPVARDVACRVNITAQPPLPPLLATTSGFAGSGGTLPLPVRPAFAYTVNGFPLPDSPTAITAPQVMGTIVPAGSTFSLLFASSSGLTQIALANGQTVTLTFPLISGLPVTGLVQLASTLVGSALLVTCTLLQPIAMTDRKVVTQFF